MNVGNARMLIVSALVLGVIGGGICQPLGASPQDVRGSGNVAVASYRNNNGMFVLWSSGRITNELGQEVNSPSAYDSGFVSLPRRVSGDIGGSPRVAVGANCSAKGTFILFSDGTLKKPRSAQAAAPLSASRRIVTGAFVTAGSSKAGDDGWSCRRRTPNAPFHIDFNKPFSSTPSVVYECVSFVEGLSKIGTSLDEKYSVCDASAEGFTIYYHSMITSTQLHISGVPLYIPKYVSFIAAADE